MSERTANPAAVSQGFPVYVEEAAVPQEWVVRGLFNAFLAVVAGVALTVALWRAGYLASITSFVMAAGAVFLYSRAAGGAPRKGLVPLVLLIVAGLAMAFLAVVASDLSEVYSAFPGHVFESRSSFVLDNVLRPEVLGAYGRDLTMFAVFGVLGVAGTLARLLHRR